MKYAQLHYFYHKILGDTKDIMSPLSKSPLELGPCTQLVTVYVCKTK